MPEEKSTFSLEMNPMFVPKAMSLMEGDPKEDIYILSQRAKRLNILA
jgi:hypothetical protein